MFDFKNKKVVVTGGGSGIGRAMSLSFAKQGAEIHIIDLDNPGTRNTLSEVQAIQSNAKLHLIDITQYEELLALGGHYRNLRDRPHRMGNIGFPGGNWEFPTSNIGFLGGNIWFPGSRCQGKTL